MKDIYFFFGRMWCALEGHDKKIDSVLHRMDGTTTTYWRCSRCDKTNYRDE